MKMNENVNYVSPEVEVVKVAVERGFEGSDIKDNVELVNPDF